MLLGGTRLPPHDALACGAVDEIVAPGEEVPAAERWVLSALGARQPWDRAEWKQKTPRTVRAAIAPVRARAMSETRGHYPAPLAILNCIERGLPQPIDRALVTEMTIFANLIQRPEPRNMIQVLFLGKLDHDRRVKANMLLAALPEIEGAVASALADVGRRARAEGVGETEVSDAWSFAGFTRPAGEFTVDEPARAIGEGRAGQGRESAGLWFERPCDTSLEALARAFIFAGAQAALPYLARVDESERRIVDYALTSKLGFPSYLGGPFALLDYLGDPGLRRAS